jgi:hypothetical protein
MIAEQQGHTATVTILMQERLSEAYSTSDAIGRYVQLMRTRLHVVQARVAALDE